MSIRDRFEDLYPATAIERVLGVLQTPELTDRVRDALRKVGLKDAKPAEQIQQIWRQAKSYLESVAELLGPDTGTSLTLNATGCLFAPNVEGVAVSASVAHAMACAATHFHHPGWFSHQARNAAVRVARSYPSWHTDLNSLFAHAVQRRIVYVAKTDVQRLPGVGDLDAILSALSIQEVGASNGCTADDWERALAGVSAESACILLVTPNGLSAEQEKAQRHAAREAARVAGIEVIELAADASISPTLSRQVHLPQLSERAADHDGLLIVPLHLFLGAPAGYLALSGEKRAAELQEKATASGTTLGIPALAAAATAIQLGAEEGALETGVIARLAANEENLRNRAQRIAIQVLGSPLVQSAAAELRRVPLGPAPWSRYTLDNWAVAMTTREAPQTLAQKLKNGKRLVGDGADGEDEGEAAGTRIAATVDADKLIFDLRFIEPRDDHLLVRALCSNIETDDPTPV